MIAAAAMPWAGASSNSCGAARSSRPSTTAARILLRPAAPSSWGETRMRSRGAPADPGGMEQGTARAQLRAGVRRDPGRARRPAWHGRPVTAEESRREPARRGRTLPARPMRASAGRRPTRSLSPEAEGGCMRRSKRRVPDVPSDSASCSAPRSVPAGGQRAVRAACRSRTRPSRARGSRATAHRRREAR